MCSTLLPSPGPRSVRAFAVFSSSAIAGLSPFKIGQKKSSPLQGRGTNRSPRYHPGSLTPHDDNLDEHTKHSSLYRSSPARPTNLKGCSTANSEVHLQRWNGPGVSAQAALRIAPKRLLILF